MYLDIIIGKYSKLYAIKYNYIENAILYAFRYSEKPQGSTIFGKTMPLTSWNQSQLTIRINS